jgi:hypothetical protein
LIVALLQSMHNLLLVLLTALSTLFKTSTTLRVENVALRQKLGVLRRSSPKRLKLTASDRLFWAWLPRVWPDWRSALMIVKPETVVAWHRKGFRVFWRWKIRHGKPSRRPETWATRGDDEFGHTDELKCKAGV